MAVSTYLTQVTITSQVTVAGNLSEKDVAKVALDLFRQGKYTEHEIDVDVLEQLS